MQQIVEGAIDVADAGGGGRKGAGQRIGAEENRGEDEIEVGLLESHDATPLTSLRKSADVGAPDARHASSHAFIFPVTYNVVR